MYVFLFFLISVALTGTVYTNRNIDSLSLNPFEEGAVFAQEKNQIPINLKNLSFKESHNISFYIEKNLDPSQIDYLGPHEGKNSEIDWVPEKRGYASLPRIVLQSTFPFGLLKAWRVFYFDKKVLIYPGRRGDFQFPQASLLPDGIDNVGLFRDHRLYQTSDSLRRIDWRASARRQELMVKNLEERNKKALVFKWEHTSSLREFEIRISQLAVWVDEAEKAGHFYSLDLEGRIVELNRGHTHWKTCMETLALLKG